jgi:hypothetical protein
MLDTSMAAEVISLRLRLLAALDASAEVSFMERAQFRLRVFGIVEALDRGEIATPTAIELFEGIQNDLDELLSRADVAS